jgi:rhodanese-related sulfurtransferase
MLQGFEVTADSVKTQMKGGERLFFVNLRHHSDGDMSLMKARGALRVDDDELERHVDEIPRDRSVVVYSTCPGDETSIRAARLLKERGLDDVHPLVGGFNAYLQAGLPVEELGRGMPATRIMLL